ncbi:dihydrodipicolinate synthase family protein [Siphonobacter aquaeclarae]|uniref:4-hydroxy-tetrahydrodipicolinate synthase n=1 Tax=Siphonobacter aquaeclarae TaxID=563176 RepID=A0A1G9V8D0_9BACT|nr:dihydrodipicolinate synthase family protein [Siphonobacter aquaeclarae]SDM68472.1 4-hydroxy-tetrahydrodipicolinate synthase [Siphonobacter aquaeclarae]
MSQHNALPEGLWPVMITPFTSSYQLDLGGLEKITRYYIDGGSNGLFANCLSSEMFQLTDDERILLTQKVLEFSAGQVPVVATGTFTRDQSKNADFIKRIYDTGVQAVILITSMLVEPDENEAILKSRLEYLMQQTGDIPLGVYECPVPYKRLLSPDLMKWMADSGRFVYHKDTSCHSGAIDRKAKAIAGSAFGFYNADTTTALDSLDSGGRGISPISGNFYIEPYTYLLKAYKEDGRTEALNRLHAVLTAMDRITHSFYPYSAKLFLQRRGMKIEAVTRIPHETLSNVDHLRLHALSDSLQLLSELYGFPLLRF